jgi:hypothetical protein
MIPDSLSMIVADLLELLFTRDLISSDEYTKFKDRLWFADKRERSMTGRSSNKGRLQGGRL